MAQYKQSLEVKTEYDTFNLVGRPCELSAFSFIPPERRNPPERNVFNASAGPQERYSSSTFDRLYHVDYGFDSKLHRCDREHAKSRGLKVNAEEKTKTVPTLASSVYGHSNDTELDPRDRKHVRIAHVKTEFYRRNGINVDPTEDAKH